MCRHERHRCQRSTQGHLRTLLAQQPAIQPTHIQAQHRNCREHQLRAEVDVGFCDVAHTDRYAVTPGSNVDAGVFFGELGIVDDRLVGKQQAGGERRQRRGAPDFAAGVRLRGWNTIENDAEEFEVHQSRDHDIGGLAETVCIHFADQALDHRELFGRTHPDRLVLGPIADVTAIIGLDPRPDDSRKNQGHASNHQWNKGSEAEFDIAGSQTHDCVQKHVGKAGEITTDGLQEFQCESCNPENLAPFGLSEACDCQQEERSPPELRQEQQRLIPTPRQRRDEQAHLTEDPRPDIDSKPRCQRIIEDIAAYSLRKARHLRADREANTERQHCQANQGEQNSLVVLTTMFGPMRHIKAEQVAVEQPDRSLDPLVSKDQQENRRLARSPEQLDAHHQRRPRQQRQLRIWTEQRDRYQKNRHE